MIYRAKSIYRVIAKTLNYHIIMLQSKTDKIYFTLLPNFEHH